MNLIVVVQFAVDSKMANFHKSPCDKMLGFGMKQKYSGPLKVWAFVEMKFLG
jgi:hypothetical protein